jgi:hypothetical protein
MSYQHINCTLENMQPNPSIHVSLIQMCLNYYMDNGFKQPFVASTRNKLIDFNMKFG